MILTNKESRIPFLKNNLFYFGLYYFGEAFTYPSAEFHAQWCHDFLSDKNMLLISFREAAKSFWAMVNTVHGICYKKFNFGMYFCYEKTKATARLYDLVVQLQANDKLKQDFGKLFSMKKRPDEEVKRKSIGEFVTENGIKVKAMSIGESPRGEVYFSKEGMFRPDYVIADDIDVEKSVQNPKVIEKNYNFIKGELFGGLAAYAKVIILGNVIRNDGVCVRIEEDYKNNEAWIISKVGILKNGVPVWDRFVLTDEEAAEYNKNVPERQRHKISLEEKKRELGSISYQQNFLLIPYLGGDSIIARSDIKYFDFDMKNLRHWKITMGIDPSFSEKTNSDPMGLTITGHLREGNDVKYYVIAGFEFKGREKDEEKFADAVESYYKNFNVSDVNVESNNGGEIIYRILKKRGMSCSLVNATKDKVTRLREYQGAFENGKVFFNSDPNMTGSLVQQLLDFPNSTHDDQVDSMVHSFHRAKKVVAMIV